MKTSNSGRTSISGKSFFDLTEKEKKEVLSEAAKQANADQAELMAKPTDQKPIWEEIEAIIRFTESDYAVSEVKKYVKEVEKAAYERGKAEEREKLKMPFIDKGWVIIVRRQDGDNILINQKLISDALYTDRMEDEGALFTETFNRMIAEIKSKL